MSWRPLVEVLPVVGQGKQAGADAHAHGHAGMPAQMFAETPQAAAHGQNRQHEPHGDDGQAPEDIHEQARQQGYEEGQAQARAENEAVAMRYRAAIEDLANARDQVVKSCEADLVRLSLTIAREVLMADVPGREAFTARMAEHVVQSLNGQQAITLRMHSKDAQALRQNKPELMRRADVVLLEDDSIEMGGVIADGGRGRIDATLATRLEQMAHKLLEEQKGS